jgi:ribosome-associated protein
MLEITPTLAIADDELVERFVRASGPGGQNVNKVSTAVELRFDAAQSPSLPEDVRHRLLARRDRRITGDGVIVIAAQRFRTQDRNREDARERLAALILAATKVAKKRVPTKPTKGSKERRLSGKRERSEVKSTRGTRGWERDA